MLLLPVKNFANAKQRLASVLDSTERWKLAEAMLEDVLEAVCSWTQRPPVAVITNVASARQLARGLSFEIIEDTRNEGETEAVRLGTRVCEERGAPYTLVIPGDIPLVEPSELQAIVDAAPDGPAGSVLVPATEERGTNGALRKPPGLFPLTFGEYSFQPHLRAARGTGQPCVVLRLPGVELDVDTPADLALMIAAETRTRTQELLREWHVRQRLEVRGNQLVATETPRHREPQE
jgi:2-phospho-L-lactate/phosphoenolpyruvate guanylyltransferase